MLALAALASAALRRAEQSGPGGGPGGGPGWKGGSGGGRGEGKGGERGEWRGGGRGRRSMVTVAATRVAAVIACAAARPPFSLLSHVDKGMLKVREWGTGGFFLRIDQVQLGQESMLPL